MLITVTFSWVYASSLHILSAFHSYKKEMSSLYSVSHVTLRTVYTVPILSCSCKTVVTGALQHRKPEICLPSPCSALTLFDRTASKWSKFPADEISLRDKEAALRDKIKWTTCGTQFTARSRRCIFFFCSTIFLSNFVARFCNQTSLYVSNS